MPTYMQFQYQFKTNLRLLLDNFGLTLTHSYINSELFQELCKITEGLSTLLSTLHIFIVSEVCTTQPKFALIFFFNPERTSILETWTVCVGVCDDLGAFTQFLSFSDNAQGNNR